MLQTVTDFTPIIEQNGGDPWVTKDAQYYYYTKTTGKNITLWRGKNLASIPASEQAVVFELPESYASIWAPELHPYHGGWLILFAMNHVDETHKMYALKTGDADPLTATWEWSAIQGMDELFAIDGTLLVIGAREYLIWSGCPIPGGAPQYLYIAQLSAWNQIIGEKTLLSKPTYAWEQRQNAPINEGPEILIDGSQINLVYSASPSWENGYCLGLLTADADAALLDPTQWTKHPTPIFDASDTVQSPGHNGFIETQDGQEKWLIYHAARWSHSGFSRSVRMQPYGFDADHHVYFPVDQPLAETYLQPLPSGDTPRMRALAAALTTTAPLVADELALGGQALALQPNQSETIELRLAEQAVVALYCHSSQHDTVQLTLKTEQSSQTLAVIGSDYYQPVYVRLPSGDTITLTADEALSIERIEILPE